MNSYLSCKSWKNAKWLWPVIGFGTLIWLLVRIIPKPSRINYPCMRASAPLAVGFIIWFIGLIGSSALALRQAMIITRKKGFILSTCITAIALSVVFLNFGSIESLARSFGSKEVFEPTDNPNTPVGTARGIFPGRVVWVHDPKAAHWSGTGETSWWEDDQTDPEAVSEMFSNSLKVLTGTNSDSAAWNALFRYFNNQHGKGNTGYRLGEKIAIKLNLNQSKTHDKLGSASFTAPQLVLALTRQLVNNAGVPAAAITFYDAIRYVPKNIYDPCKKEFPDLRFADWAGGDGRFKCQRDTSVQIHWSETLNLELGGSNPTFLPKCVTEASYLINLAGFKGHSLAGVTFCAKNHLGSILADLTGNFDATFTPKGAGIHPYLTVHSFKWAVGWEFQPRPMNTYNSLVDLMGHNDLGEKTLLFIVDGLYAVSDQSAVVNTNCKWQSAPFNNRWTSSIFLSLDQVALESVLLDLARTEQAIQKSEAMTEVYGTVDNYLHEAAQADKPPSGTVYDPDDDGKPLASLGVHEHWNNASEKKYSRNLSSTGKGIELLKVDSAYVSIHNYISTSTQFDDSMLYLAPVEQNNHRVVFRYMVPSLQSCNIAIFNLSGKVVWQRNLHLTSDNKETVLWDGMAITPGIYIVRLSHGRRCIFQPFTLK